MLLEDTLMACHEEGITWPEYGNDRQAVETIFPRRRPRGQPSLAKPPTKGDVCGFAIAGCPLWLIIDA